MKTFNLTSLMLLITLASFFCSACFHLLVWSFPTFSKTKVHSLTNSTRQIQIKQNTEIIKNPFETNKIRIVVKLLEDCADNKSTTLECFLTFEGAKEALEEVEKLDARVGIRVKRAEPLINCAEWLLRPLVASGKNSIKRAWKKMESNYKLFRQQCKLGLVDYFIAHGENLQNLASALLWELQGAPKLSDELFRKASSEYNDYFDSYYELESNEENFDQIEWTLQYLNSRAARTIMQKIMPLYESGKVPPDTLKDIFTDEMRYLGNFVEMGEQHYFNYDIDIIPILYPK